MTYYERNKEKILQRCKEKYAKNRQDPVFMQAKRDRQRNKSVEEKLVIAARRRAQLRGLEFEISPEDVVMQEFCPILGIKIKQNLGKVGRDSPSLDRKNPLKGYTKDNIWVISHKANSMKSDADGETLKLFSKWIEKEYGKL